MKFTDLFIRRPVLALVINLIIIIAGLQAIRTVNVRQFPHSESSAVKITTVYVGASPELVRGFITTPLERAIAAADGIDYMQSKSAQGLSTITVRLELNYDSIKALSEISSKVDQVRQDLPPEAEVPVINGLTDLSHPCQIVADLLTLVESGKSLPGMQLAWLGDGNNVLNSIVEAAGLFQFAVRIGVPEGYDSDAGFIDRARAAGADISIHRDAASAVAGADVIVTDTWVSMGQEHVHNKLAAMAPYRVNAALMSDAADNALFLHCLPAHRGEEVVDAVIDGPQSRVWDEAENRLHAQKSVLLWAMEKLG